jgi:hypothetical protein
MVGVVAIPKRQQIAMPLDHDGLPPAAFARLSRQHEAAWHDFMPGAWQRFVGCGWVVRRLLNQHGRRQFRIGVAADMRQETRGRWRAADRVEWLASARQASGSKLGRAARRRLGQRLDVPRPEPGGPRSGAFVGAENDVCLGQRLRRLWCAIGHTGSPWNAKRPGGPFERRWWTGLWMVGLVDPQVADGAGGSAGSHAAALLRPGSRRSPQRCLPAQAAVRSRHDGSPPTTWGNGTPAAASVFFGQHDCDDAPGYGRVGRIG